MEYETIYGQVIGKANNYLCVPDERGGYRLVKSEIVRRYERNFMNQCVKYKNFGCDRPFTLHVSVYEQSNAFDLDNGIKTILDCLQYVGAIRNDNLCTAINATKHIDPQRPRIIFAIQENEPRLF